MSMEHSQRLEPLAKDVVDKLDTVASTARQWLANPRRLGIDALATGGNTLNSDRAARALDEVNQANESAYRKLASEPAIARVIAEDDDGHRTVTTSVAPSRASPTWAWSAIAPVGAWRPCRSARSTSAPMARP